MELIREQYPTIFGQSQRPSKPTSIEYREFSKKWNWKKTFIELSNEEIVKFKETAQIYLTTTLEFLSYQIDKSIAEEYEDKFQDNIRKQKRT